MIDTTLSLLKEYGMYLAIPILVSAIMQAIKTFLLGSSSKFAFRFLHFVPLILGALAGWCSLPGTVSARLLMGGALGALSHVIYKTMTKTIKKMESVTEVATGSETPTTPPDAPSSDLETPKESAR